MEGARNKEQEPGAGTGAAHWGQAFYHPSSSSEVSQDSSFSQCATPYAYNLIYWLQLYSASKLEASRLQVDDIVLKWMLWA